MSFILFPCTRNLLLVFNLMDRFCGDLCVGQSEKRTRHGRKLLRAERLWAFYNRARCCVSLPCGSTVKVFLSASVCGRQPWPEISLNLLSPRFSRSA